MFYIVFTIHVTLCVALILLVLIQQGKGADAGAIMGGGTDSLLGAGSAGSAVSKMTTSLAIGFMITSIILVKTYAQKPVGTVSDPLSGSVLGGMEEQTSPPLDSAPLEGVAPISPAEDGLSVEEGADETAAGAGAILPQDAAVQNESMQKEETQKQAGTIETEAQAIPESAEKTE